MRLLNRRWSAIPFAIIVVFVMVSSVLAFLPTPWPFFAVYADLALTLAPPFEGFHLVVFIVDFLSLLSIFSLGRIFSHRFGGPSSTSFAILGYGAAAVLVLGCFLLYPLVKSGVNSLRYSGGSEDGTIALLMMNWYDEHTTHGVVVTTRETATPLWLQISSLSPEESLEIRITDSQMRELRRLLRRRGYFSLPNRVDVMPSSDHSLYGVSLFVDGRERHVFAKVSSDGFGRFARVWEGVLDYLDLPSNWEWSQRVPGRLDYRERAQEDAP